MKARKVILLLCALLAVTSLFAFSSCSKPESEKEHVTVYLWSVDLLDSFAPYVSEQLPDIEIEWIAGNNDLDFYEFMDEHGELPDIITNRRFSVIDAADLNDTLVDLSGTEVAASFYTTYLENYRNADGSVNWLPACGEVDGYIANKDLFDRYGIPLPTDYPSFVTACKSFEEHGIRGFASDFTYDYTCLEVLQGSSIPLLNSLDGRLWRLDYENGLTSELDDVVWPQVFSNFETFIADTGLTAEDASMNYSGWRTAFINEEVAIVRGTGVDIGTMATSGLDNVVFLPYFGATPEENWVLTYPSFHVAVSRGAEKSGDHYDATMRVLETMLSNEGQNHIAPNHTAVPYNQDVTLELSSELREIEPYIESNHLYIRLASNDFFSTSHEVVHLMLKGEYDASEAYATFNSLLSNPAAQDKSVYSFETSYDYALDERSGRESASVVANTLRAACASDILIAPSTLCTGPIYACDYSSEHLGYLIGPNNPTLHTSQLTGAEIVELVRLIITLDDDTMPTVVNKYNLPITSGVEIRVSEGPAGNVELIGLSINGEPLDESASYAVTYAENKSIAEPCMSMALGPERAKEFFSDASGSSTLARKTWLNHLASGGQLSEPSDYLELTQS